jgi:hypothetical protein
MPIFTYKDPDFFESVTGPKLRYARELGQRAGLQLGAVQVGEDGGGGPVAMILELPPGYRLERHSHGCHRVEVVIRGSIEAADGGVLEPGDVMTSGPGQVYGPHTAGPEGAVTVEIFSSTAGLVPSPGYGADADAAALLWDIAQRARTAQEYQRPEHPVGSTAPDEAK